MKPLDVPVGMYLSDRSGWIVHEAVPADRKPARFMKRAGCCFCSFYKNRPACLSVSCTPESRRDRRFVYFTEVRIYDPDGNRIQDRKSVV